MHINKEAMGERAVKKLIEKMNGQESMDEKIVLPVYPYRKTVSKANRLIELNGCFNLLSGVC